MKKDELEIMNDITLIDQHQGLLLEKLRSVQQELFQVYGQRHLLTRKMMHRHLQEVLQFLPGSFGQTALYTLYLSVCLEMKIEIDPDNHPLLKRLIGWSQMFPELKEEQQISLVQSITPVETLFALNSFEEYITYLNFISVDLIKLISGTKGNEKIDKISLTLFKADDLIQFLINSLPKVLFNVILPVDVVPPQYRTNNMQILFSTSSLQYFMRSKTSYSTLIKLLIKILLKLQLKQSQQKTMMEIVFRYFYCYHHDKKYAATDLFIQGYNKMNQSVRFAMADQFVLFFRVIQKIGKGKFCQFLMEKSEWLKEIYKKVSFGNLIGYSKEGLNPFPTLKISDRIQVANGEVEQRTFEILQDYSLFYFCIDIAAQDVTVRLNYLGDFNATSSTCVKLLNYQKQSGILKANIMAARKGLYQFEFDNSYSWMNKKVVRLEKIVMTPLAFKSEDTPTWVKSYYDNIPLNAIKDQKMVFAISKKQVLAPKKEQNHDGIANITIIGRFFNLKIQRRDNVYEFETMSEDKLVNKFNEIVDIGGKIKWLIGGEPLQEPEKLKEMLSKQEKKDSEQDQEVQKVQAEKPQEMPIKKGSKKEEKPKNKQQVLGKWEEKKAQKKATQ